MGQWGQVLNLELYILSLLSPLFDQSGLEPSLEKMTRPFMFYFYVEALGMVSVKLPHFG